LRGTSGISIDASREPLDHSSQLERAAWLQIVQVGPQNFLESPLETSRNDQTSRISP